jgi:hypothetical protein
MPQCLQLDRNMIEPIGKVAEYVPKQYVPGTASWSSGGRSGGGTVAP